ncbi:ABC transporter permease [Aurantibacillus circumpalustris]|uniref:ABC transporter permease n=1 Tax=Aurantibacillus circumpalustris TaxID=3036359 RepID=UPI00295AD500|nr:ABC transporter permease [Aurantibacillus circumpalustris]
MKTIITSNDKSFLNLSELRRYSSLLNNLAKRDFLVRYKQAFAGIIWALVKPLINILVFGYIASKINSGQDAATNFVYVASAMVLWQLFSNVFNDVSNSIVGNSNLFSKVYFPKIIIPIGSTLVCLVDFLISLIILVALFVITGKDLHWQLILTPVFIGLTLINGLGLGLYFATINVKFRDIKFIVPVMIQFGMYVTPVIFSSAYYLERIPTSLHWLFCLNPMVGVIDGFKYCLFGDVITYHYIYFFLSIFSSFLFLFIGVKYFYKFERNFVDYI